MMLRICRMVACLALVPQVGVAQERALGIVGGAWSYDLSGTGTSAFGGLRAEFTVARPVVIEPGLTYARYSSQFGPSVNYLIPEIQGQLQIPGSTLRPFLGAGIGFAYAWAEGEHVTDLSLSAGLGTRVRLSEDWSARAELRVRSIDPWTGNAAEWTAGIAHRF
jgi:hypothetical protein